MAEELDKEISNNNESSQTASPFQQELSVNNNNDWKAATNARDNQTSSIADSIVPLSIVGKYPDEIGKGKTTPQDNPAPPGATQQPKSAGPAGVNEAAPGHKLEDASQIKKPGQAQTENSQSLGMGQNTAEASQDKSSANEKPVARSPEGKVKAPPQDPENRQEKAPAPDKDDHKQGKPKESQTNPNERKNDKLNQKGIKYLVMDSPYKDKFAT